MGNCLFGGLGDEEDLLIKVIKSDGVEFLSSSPPSPRAPSPTNSQTMLFSRPLTSSGNPCLIITSLSPVSPTISFQTLSPTASGKLPHEIQQRVGSCHMRSNSESLSAMTPYRLSLDYNHRVLKRSYTDVFSRNNYIRTRQKEKRTRRRRSSSKGGIWKVKLVINTEELLQILSEDGRTNELIESVRAVAKGENVVTSSITSGNSSENVLSVVHT